MKLFPELHSRRRWWRWMFSPSLAWEEYCILEKWDDWKWDRYAIVVLLRPRSKVDDDFDRYKSQYFGIRPRSEAAYFELGVLKEILELIEKAFDIRRELKQGTLERRQERVKGLREEIANLEREVAELKQIKLAQMKAQKVEIARVTFQEVVKYAPKVGALIEKINKHRLWLLLLVFLVFVTIAGLDYQTTLKLVFMIGALLWIGLKSGSQPPSRKLVRF